MVQWKFYLIFVSTLIDNLVFANSKTIWNNLHSIIWMTSKNQRVNDIKTAIVSQTFALCLLKILKLRVY